MYILNFIHKKAPAPEIDTESTESTENESKPIDTVSTIYLDREQKYFLSLDYPDEHEYKELLEIVRAKLRSWMLMDIDLARSVDRAVDSSLSIKLATIDIKFLPKTGNWTQFLSYIENNPIYSPLTRLLDTIDQLAMEVPPKFLETVKGRFLYGMVYMMPKKCSSHDLPTKDEWVSILTQMPWIFLLPIIQELYDTDKVIQLLNRKLELNKAKEELVVQPKMSL